MALLYGVTAIVVFLGVTWFARRSLAPTGVVVPRAWRAAGLLVWLSMLLGGFSGIRQVVEPLLSQLSAPIAAVAGGALFGGIVAFLVLVGAGLSLYADARFWRWAVLYQVVALAGDILAGGSIGNPVYAAAAVVPAAGLIALALARRTPPEAPARAKPRR